MKRREEEEKAKARREKSQMRSKERFNAEQLGQKLSAPVVRPKVDYGVPNNHEDYQDLL